MTTDAPASSPSEAPLRNPRAPNRLPLYLGLAAVLVIAGVVLLLVFLAEGAPTLAYDGTTGTYTGPDTVEAGVVTLTFENNHDGTMSFAWALYGDETVTLEQEIAYAEEQAGTISPPPWVVDSGWSVLDAGTTTEVDVLMSGGVYLLYVWDDTIRRAYPVAHLEVTGD